jgi:hypothetical protein
MDIRTKDGEKALCAVIAYKKDTVVYKLQGIVRDKPTRESIELSPTEHIDDEWGMYMNHSFNPTCRICGIERGIVALKDIEAGEELTFNYNDSETCMSDPFVDRATGTQVAGKAVVSPPTPGVAPSP